MFLLVFKSVSSVGWPDELTSDIQIPGRSKLSRITMILLRMKIDSLKTKPSLPL